MFGFGKSAQQKRIDADAKVIAGLRQQVASLQSDRANQANRLRIELATNDALDRTAKKYRQERDEYKPDALKFRALTSNLIPGGPKAKAKRDAANGTAAAVQGPN